MKRLLLIIISVLMLFSVVLAACAPANETSATSSQAKEDSFSSEAESSHTSSDINIESNSEEESIVESANESFESISSEASDENSEESSQENSDESSQETSEESDTTQATHKEIEILFTRYSEGKKSAVIFGKCEMDAEVTVEFGEISVNVDSYMGYFSAYIENPPALFTAEISQKVNGEMLGEVNSVRIQPKVSSKTHLQEVIASNEAFQFFLSQMINDFEGTNLYSESVISAMETRVSGRIDTVRSHNPDAEIIYMIVPSAMTIYPELVPDFYTPAQGERRMDQVMNGLENAGATVIDLREVFNQHKHDEMPLYYKLDSHWADYGAFLAYTRLFNHISQKYPDAAPRNIDDFNWNPDYYRSADVISYFDYPQNLVEEYGYYRQYNFEIPSVINTYPRYRLPQLLYSDQSTYEIFMETQRENLPSCMVYRDSFGAAIYDLIPERMNNTHYIGMWNYGWNNRQIEKEKPDYIIYIVAEWNLDEIVYK